MADIVGNRIVEIRQMTRAEQEAEGWSKGTTAIVLENGIVLYASHDEEGNGAGEMFGNDNGKTFMLALS